MNIDLLRKLGNIDQIANIRSLEINTGPGKGMEIIEVNNAAGVRFTLLPDRCLDIYDFSYKGVNFAFHTKNGLIAGAEQAEDEFFHRWQGGLLSTCGLSNVGNACVDGGFHPTHGRLRTAAAKNVSTDAEWVGDDYRLSVSGTVLETRLYGRCLSLRRTISIGLFDKALTISDSIENNGGEDEEFMLLYHINFGYPLLDSSSKVLVLNAATEPMNDVSSDWANMSVPGSTPHQQFMHYPKGGFAKAALYNPELELAASVGYDTANLPYLCEWKNPMAHDYVLALEPCNCFVLGRAAERANGTLKKLPAYSSIKHRLIIGALAGAAELDAFMKT